MGLVEFKGSKDNNIILTEKDPDLGYICHNFSPFLDSNPAAPKSERYKAIGGGPLFAMVSADGAALEKGLDDADRHRRRLRFAESRVLGTLYPASIARIIAS